MANILIIEDETQIRDNLVRFLKLEGLSGEERSKRAQELAIAHSAESAKGVLIVLVDATASELFRGGLIARGFRPSVRRLD